MRDVLTIIKGKVRSVLALTNPGYRLLLIFVDRHKHYLKNGMEPVWFATTAAKEVNALNRVDAVIAIQESEAAYLKSQGICEVFCVGHILGHECLPLPDPGGRRMLFVGLGQSD